MTAVLARPDFSSDVLAETGLAEPSRYPPVAEDAFYWAETMPEEIQVWPFHALRPHLLAVNLPRLEARTASRCDKARAWLSMGNLNVATRVQALDIEDMARGLVINHRTAHPGTAGGVLCR
jgi:hypothetical protein